MEENEHRKSTTDSANGSVAEHDWSNPRPQEWLTSMKQHENQAVCADAEPNI